MSALVETRGHCIDCDPVTTIGDLIVAAACIEIVARQLDAALHEVMACEQEANAAMRRLILARERALTLASISEEAFTNYTRVQSARK